ncbi:hypothetical protein [Kitasatospora sp. NPDC015120]|uniref:hypothetical protein n=1 Tax=Kitasatospora sp. NPDC015120 TaxID=3364023 RepID=UPI0036F45D73
MEIDISDVPLDLVPVVVARTRRELEQAAPTIPDARTRDATRTHSRFAGPGWAFVRWAPLRDGYAILNARHILTTDPEHRWWSIPVHPRSPYYLFNPANGRPADGSARPYPHPVTPDGTDPLGLCPHCGSRGWRPVRCTPDDPDRHHEHYGRPWKRTRCPAECEPVTNTRHLFTPEHHP